MENYWDGALWVCTDCYLAREGDGPTEEVEHEPWGLLDDTYQVACGLTEEAHDERCTPDMQDDGSCTCEYIDFSYSDCDACGSDLGGSRFAYAYKVVS